MKTDFKKATALVVCLLLHFTALCKEIDYKALFRQTADGVVVLYGSNDETNSKGTGSIIDASGLVLTNSHVVTHQGKPWKELFVILKPAQLTGSADKDLVNPLKGIILAINPKYDLALVQITPVPNGLKPLPLSDLSSIAVGEPTIAIGHPGGGAFWTLTTGQISAEWTDYDKISGWDVYQTQTPLNPGNSGGPLLDGSGAIIGVNTFIVRSNRQGMALDGLNFAIKSTTIRRWIVEVQGKLPPASAMPAASPAAPTPLAVQQAGVTKSPSPLQLQEFYWDQSFAGQRQIALQQAPPREAAYQSTLRPGISINPTEFNKTLQRIDKLDSNLTQDPFFEGL